MISATTRGELIVGFLTTECEWRGSGVTRPPRLLGDQDQIEPARPETVGRVSSGRSGAAPSGAGTVRSALFLTPRSISRLMKQLTSWAGRTISADHRCENAYRSRTTSLVVPSGWGSSTKAHVKS